MTKPRITARNAMNWAHQRTNEELQHVLNNPHMGDDARMAAFRELELRKMVGWKSHSSSSWIGV